MYKRYKGKKYIKFIIAVGVAVYSSEMTVTVIVNFKIPGKHVLAGAEWSLQFFRHLSYLLFRGVCSMMKRKSRPIRPDMLEAHF